MCYSIKTYEIDGFTVQENGIVRNDTGLLVGRLSDLGSFAAARTTMRQAFESDPDFKRVYRDNVAMLLHDRHGITGHTERNDAAEDILNLIFFT